MSNPSPRFTGIFIPAEILELESLTLFEMMLLSWIDALYCPEHGGCYASNEYLGQKIRGAKENTVAKAITNLRSMGLIEDVSFDGRQRIIRALINRRIEQTQSKSGLDKNPTRVGQKSNPDMDIHPSSPYIYSKDENKEREGGKPPPHAPPLLKKIVRKEHVSTTEEEHKKLCAEKGETIVELAYQELSDWKKNTARSKWKKEDYLSIRKWVFAAIEEKDVKKSLTAGSCILTHRKLGEKIWNKLKASRNDISMSANFLEFLNGPASPSTILNFEDKSFRAKAIEELRRRNINVNGL